MNQITRPQNCNSNLINMLGLLAAALVVLTLHGSEVNQPVIHALMVAGAYIATIAVLEVLLLRTPRRESTGLDFSRWQPSPSRIAVKFIGLYGTLGMIALLYWLFPEYNGSYYNMFYRAVSLVGPAFAIASVPYVLFMDGFSKDPRDSYYLFGAWLLGNGRGTPRAIIIQHVLGWVVKAFFLPLMFVSFAGNIRALTTADFSAYFTHFQTFYQLSTTLMFTIDLLVAVAGYAFTLKLFDSHIRSAEPTLLGWTICLMCYQPFLSVYMRLYLPYANNEAMAWLNDSPTLQMAWGSVALSALFVYTATSVNFGLRFSNLTHRGILTTGLYRFTKHPAYVGKNTFWWLVYIPFVSTSGDWLEALRYTILMCGISGVYYLRARTEEAHLSRDPAYVQYALYMNEHSVFRHVTKVLPFLRYQAPAGWETFPAPYAGIRS